MWPLTRDGSDPPRPVRVSEVATADRCPLRLYHLLDRVRPESGRYVIAKTIARHHGDGADPDLLWEEVQTVMPGIDPAQKTYLSTTLAACSRMEWPPFTEQDLPVRSEKHRLVGTVDLAGGPHGRFGVVRSSSAPTTGVYTADRVRVAAYALCLEELYHMPVREGLVLYLQDGAIRTCPISPRDRRAVLNARDAAARVIKGEMPRRPLNPPCTNCPAADVCRQGARSRFEQG